MLSEQDLIYKIYLREMNKVNEKELQIIYNTLNDIALCLDLINKRLEVLDKQHKELNQKLAVKLIHWGEQ